MKPFKMARTKFTYKNEDLPLEPSSQSKATPSTDSVMTRAFCPPQRLLNAEREPLSGQPYQKRLGMAVSPTKGTS